MAKKEKDPEKEDEPKGKGKVEPTLDGGGGEGGADGAEGEGEGGKKGLNAKKIVLFVVLPFFLLIGAGAGLYFTGTLDKFLKKDAEQHAEAGDEKGAHGDKKKADAHGKGGKEGEGTAASAYFLKIPDMLVNLASADGQPRYLRLSVQLELGSQADMTAVEAVMPRVVDQFQTYLRELRVKDLRGSQGIYRLQTELLSRVNAAAYPIEVKDVLFQEILIQ